MEAFFRVCQICAQVITDRRIKVAQCTLSLRLNSVDNDFSMRLWSPNAPHRCSGCGSDMFIAPSKRQSDEIYRLRRTVHQQCYAVESFGFRCDKVCNISGSRCLSASGKLKKPTTHRKEKDLRMKIDLYYVDRIAATTAWYSSWDARRCMFYALDCARISDVVETRTLQNPADGLCYLLFYGCTVITFPK